MPLDEKVLAELRARLSGRVITPDDSAYDQARTVFYGGIDRRPQAILLPQSDADVRQVVTWARESGSELAIRGGGHSPVGHSLSDGGVVLDLREMKGFDLDLERRTAWAQGGLTAGEYTSAAGAHGLATGFGDTGSVGIGGLTLGGGVGFLVRKFGLTIDDLLAADVVTADGQLLRAQAESNPDLFWAIRGGGGNFGVVTRFQFRLHPIEPFVGGIFVLPATADVVAGFLAEAEAAPEELSTIANVMPAPPMPFVPPEYHGKLIVLAFMAFAGKVEAAERALAPFRGLATPIADMVRPMKYPEMYGPEPGDYHPTAVGRTMFVDSIDRSIAQDILARLEASDASVRVAQLRVLGGAMARVPNEATAFAHRASRILVNLAAFYEGVEDRPRREQWVKEFEATLRQKDNGAYVNFLGEEGPSLVHRAYPGSTWDRLVDVKRRYDPGNLFHRNHNLPPDSP
ncbi:MAG TPA: FAD-binding oxidoreductase [Anaerolineales bacterium]|nr:FAD-binding oxidoreductase [Anaerolineales bacterium]